MTSTENLADFQRIWVRMMSGFGLRFEEISPDRVYVHVPFSQTRE